MDLLPLRVSLRPALIREAATRSRSEHGASERHVSCSGSCFRARLCQPGGNNVPVPFQRLDPVSQPERVGSRGLPDPDFVSQQHKIAPRFGLRAWTHSATPRSSGAGRPTDLSPLSSASLAPLSWEKAHRHLAGARQLPGSSKGQVKAVRPMRSIA